jgi:hypothetical protein
VLAGGLSSEFEEEVIRERWKLIKKKNEVKDPKKNPVKKS